MGSPSASLLEVILATRLLVVVGEPGEIDAAVITGNASKLAVHVVFDMRVTTQEPVPVQPPPLQPRRAEFVSGVAVCVTMELPAKLAVQVVPQLMPVGTLVTVPVPAPLFTTERLKFANGATIVRIPDALATDWPSGFVTVTANTPARALLATVTFSVILVGFEYATLLTVTLPPLTVAEIWFGKPAPGSKKPEPFDDVPVTTMLTLATPWVIDEGLQLTGVAGGGARSLTTRTPYELAESQNSWMVHMLMSSFGSRLVNE